MQTDVGYPAGKSTPIASPLVIGVGQLRSGILGYLDEVGAGRTFVVLHRGRPVAHFRQVRPTDYATSKILCARSLRDRAGRVLDEVEAGTSIIVTRDGYGVGLLQAMPGRRP